MELYRNYGNRPMTGLSNGLPEPNGKALIWEKNLMQEIANCLKSIVSWMDDRGKGAWICAMVLGFIFFWPLGLGILFFLLWSKRMYKKSKSLKRMSEKLGLKSTENSAFESYKQETISRLKAEQAEFEAFLDRLRKSKDKAEFEQFMSERGRDSSPVA